MITPQINKSPSKSTAESQVPPPLPVARTKSAPRLADSLVTTGKVFKVNFEAVALVLKKNL